MYTMHVHIRFCVDTTHGSRVRSQNTNFGSNFESNLTFDPTGRGQFLENFKNAVTGLFLLSSCFTVPIFVHIGPAESE